MHDKPHVGEAETTDATSDTNLYVLPVAVIHDEKQSSALQRVSCVRTVLGLDIVDPT